MEEEEKDKFLAKYLTKKQDQNLRKKLMYLNFQVIGASISCYLASQNFGKSILFLTGYVKYFYYRSVHY